MIMIKRLLLCLLCLAPISAWGNTASLDMQHFSKIPVLHDGRIKPLDTLARHYTKQLYGKETAPSGDAIHWLADLLFNPIAAEQPLFLIRSRDVVSTLGLEERDSRLYSYLEVAQTLHDQKDTVLSLLVRDSSTLSPSQQALVDLHDQIAITSQLMLALSAILPLKQTPSEELLAELKYGGNTPVTYMDVLAVRESLEQLKSDEAKQLTAFIYNLESAGTNQHLLRILPPSWEGDGEDWHTPWQVLLEGRGSAQSANYLALWMKMAAAYQAGDSGGWAETTKESLEFASGLTPETISVKLLTLENWYHRFSPFDISFVFYLLGLVCFLVSSYRPSQKWNNTTRSFVTIGLLLHAASVVMRIIILGRPPVSNLYESVIFVGFIVALMGWLMDRRGMGSEGLAIAAFTGCLLFFVGNGLATHGDTFGTLMPVLDSGFWLSTHVICITLGYAACLITGLLAHMHLWRGDKGFPRYLLTFMAASLFLTAFGTMLGGLWADQSWGRFWGWDPKENGALLIVLWLTWLMHGRICGYLGSRALLAGLATLNIIVALAWFGVNLLSVGLHSYGFTDSAAWGLFGFCAAELLIIIMLYHGVLKRRTG